jgi:hypothetical protein
MDPFPPGFPFVSRTPEPASEPTPAAAPDPVVPEATCEPAPSAAEPETPSYSWRSADERPADPEPQPAAACEPWPFRPRDAEPVIAAEPAAAAPDPVVEPDAAPGIVEREPWPFPRRRGEPAVASEPAPAPEAERDAFPFRRRESQPAIAPAPEPIAINPAVTPAALPNVERHASSPSDVPPTHSARSAPEPKKIVPAAPPVVKNERRKIRRDALNTAALLRVDGVHGPPLKIELSDISIAGARFRSPQKLDLGDKAQVRVEVGPFRWTTRLRVVHCEPLDDGGASIGCAFLRTELLRPWPVAA